MAAPLRKAPRLLATLAASALVVGLLAPMPAHAGPEIEECFEGRWYERAQVGDQDFTFVLRITTRDGEVRGAFTWRQIHTTRDPSDDGRIGQEIVVGRRVGNRITMRGVRVTAPDLLGVDRYRVEITGDRMRGESATHESDWSGRLTARRTSCDSVPATR